MVALQTMLDRWDAVVCAESSHINVDEGGAPEKVAGIKLLTAPAWDGKLTPELIDRQAWGFEDEHRARPRVVSIAQSTELGTCYTPDEIRAICDHAHDLGMLVYLDGARLANAAATLGVSLREMTTDAGVDVLSLGGTKNGLLLGEAVIVLNEDAVRGMAHLRKASMQLGSKMRFVSVQFEALLGGASGCARRPAPTRWPGGCTRRCANCRVWRSPARCRPTRSSPSCRRPSPSVSRSVSASAPGTNRPARSAG
ncbi:threonine aldolase [Streptomyces sp. B4I13]|nr:threonine aldolase [Streptomyces sp. B4I13]